MSDIDQLSNTSGSSASQQKVPCSHCNKDFQLRTLFNHMKTKHPLECVNLLTEKSLVMKDLTVPLEIWYEWKDEQDEERIRKVWVCLSTNKTFITPEGCLKHWTKSPKDKKNHVSMMSVYKKQVAIITAKNKYINHFLQAQKVKDLNLTRAIYSRFLYLQELINALVKKVSRIKDNSPPGKTDPSAWSFIIASELPIFIEKHITPIYTLIENRKLEFDLALEGYWKLEKFLDYISNHTDFGVYVSPKTERNEIGIIWPTRSDPPYYNVGDPDYPQVDF
jgi:hypothetical protein